MLRYITILLLMPCFATAQPGDSVIRKGDTTIIKNNDTGEQVFVYVEQMPKPGYNVNQFLLENMRYPEEAIQNLKRGKVQVRFVVDTSGAIKDATVLKSIDPSLDAEALRLINLLPPWQPARQNGKAVPVWYTLPVMFDSLIVFSYVEQMPEPGYDVYQFLEKNKVYPEDAKGIRARIAVVFIVSYSGEIKEARIAGNNRLHPSLEKEAIRLVSSLPKWRPGKQNGIGANVYYTLPITF